MRPTSKDDPFLTYRQGCRQLIFGMLEGHASSLVCATVCGLSLVLVLVQCLTCPGISDRHCAGL